MAKSRTKGSSSKPKARPAPQARSGRNAPRRAGRPFPIERVLETVREVVDNWRKPVVTEIALAGRDPYKILISTLLSLRTKDETTAAASARLFELADNPRAMRALGRRRIAKAIFPVGFYNIKARTICEICTVLLESYDGRVPDELDALLALKGVGRKTANLVLTLGFGKPGICVDTHVHRITNRWGYVKTPNPDATEMALRASLPPQYWIPINDWLVSYGQRICRPVSPLCSQCQLAGDCRREGVARHR